MGTETAFYTIVGQYSPSVPPQFWHTGFLFNDPAHIRQQGQWPFYTVSALNKATQLAEARCTIFWEPTATVSPLAAPFGSIEFAPTLPDAVLHDLLRALIEASTKAGASTLRVVNYPRCYAPEQTDRLRQLFAAQGFCTVSTHPTFYLPVSHKPFKSSLAQSERRRLRKCQRAGFQFIHWQDPDIDTAITFLATTYQERGYQLSITPERLKNVLYQFQDKFSVFAVMDFKRIAALVITVRVSDTILYSFLPGSHSDYRTYSPMVMLIDELYHYCQQQSISLLDLGLSVDGNQLPKPSLMQFKRNLGAQESPKLVVEKRL
ncbi:GNAT family N-acetyltransferase [Spirosoma fluminis]